MLAESPSAILEIGEQGADGRPTRNSRQLIAEETRTRVACPGDYRPVTRVSSEVSTSLYEAHGPKNQEAAQRSRILPALSGSVYCRQGVNPPFA